jgi:hypothetical protein
LGMPQMFRLTKEMKLITIPITIKEANEFVFNFHRHNRPVTGGKFAIGAEWDGKMVGVVIVGRPIARLLNDDYTAEVYRTCTSPGAPPNTNSFLYGAAWRASKAMGYRKLITYTLQTESGASLRGAGWKVVGEVKPSGNWGSSKRKREWQPIFGQLKLRWETQ